MYKLFSIALCVFLFVNCGDSADENPPEEMMPDEEIPFVDTLRFASYNVSMFGNSEGQVAEQMLNANQFTRYKRIAAVIQEVRPDVLALMEFDYDSTGESIRLFNDNLLSVSQNGDDTINYKYTYQFISNTGVLADTDLDGNGSISLPNDAYGFGNFPGQYAFAILSKYPIEEGNIRSFREFLWKHMPDAALPQNPDGSSYYSEEVLEVFRLSSKNHVDVPIRLPDGDIVHALLSHPTPPVFDGPEDRNGRRNHDEIRLLADYINNETYLVDDNGQQGGLNAGESFIVFGDLNAEPLDGDSYNSAVKLLLEDSNINQDVAQGSLIPSSNGGAEYNRGSSDQGDPAFDTSFFGLRIDYVLPSSDLNAIDSGVYWPSSQEAGHELIQDERASDHLLVWVDIAFE